MTLIMLASAVLLSVTLLGERLEPFEIAGMVLIALGLVTIGEHLFRCHQPADL